MRGQRATLGRPDPSLRRKGQLGMWVTKRNSRQFQQGDQTVGHSSGRTCTARLRCRTLRRTDPPTAVRYLIPLSGWLGSAMMIFHGTDKKGKTTVQRETKILPEPSNDGCNREKKIVHGSGATCFKLTRNDYHPSADQPPLQDSASSDSSG